MASPTTVTDGTDAAVGELVTISESTALVAKEFDNHEKVHALTHWLRRMNRDIATALMIFLGSTSVRCYLFIDYAMLHSNTTIQ